ncbi:MAG: phosphodiester glycosidase family protein [Agathobacter sp.]|nr:phosphodiester glycosidase family protein [Agathobacter sp.]
MKIAKKFLVFALVASMLVSPSLVAEASSIVSWQLQGEYAVTDGVSYYDYNMYGSSSRHTEAVSVLEFNPEDGYIPMAFAAHSGSVDTLASHYSTAVNKYGYEVVGVINGSYFDMDGTDTLTGMLISGGKVSCTDIGYTYGNLLDVVAFGYDGSMNLVKSQLGYNLYINGSLVPDALRFINKAQDSSDWRTDAIFYYDTSCGNYADSSSGNYEVICRKTQGTDLCVGETMTAEVIQINGYTSGSQLDNNANAVSDNFVLTTPSNSSYIGYLTGLSVGDTVEISVEETVAESVEIMENASSVITNVGTLVKDGVDLTDSTSVIGDHSVSGTYARWTAFGQKADGTYVYFTSEGGDTGNTSRSLTLKDVAAAMVKLGCVNAVRMDGGGSTAMYVSNTGSGSAGYKMSSSRAVADCMLIVKKTAGKPDLKLALNAAKNITFTDYSEADLATLRAAYEEGRTVYYSETATDTDYVNAANKINALLEKGPSASDKVTDGIYVTDFNSSITDGDCVIFTPDFNGGNITPAAANHNWTYNVILTWDEESGKYVVNEVSQGNGENTPTYELTEGMIMIAGHKDESDPASVANYELLSQTKPGQEINLYGIDVDSCYLSIAPYFTVTGEGSSITIPSKADIMYQTNGSDIRLVAYVDDLLSYDSVAFTITVDGMTSKELVCTTAYKALYANGEPVTTTELYGKDGYFVTYVITNYMNYFSGRDLSINVKYTAATAAAQEYTQSRTEVIGISGNLTYVNGYDWTASMIYAFGQGNASQTVPTILGQAASSFGWWYGIVLEYDEATDIWTVVESDFVMDGTCSALDNALDENTIAIIFHDTAAGTDDFNFFTQYALLNAEFRLNTSASTLHSASGAVSNLKLIYVTP